jgi:hypothetical protein
VWVIAELLRRLNLADKGPAAVCAADPPMLKALNPTLGFTGEKTLMKGYDCCERCSKWPRV